ncbi:hypothetical protein HCN44_008944 [Aphidius gifuensis]|uniref:F-box domain-containing protein n=1 Tax=Aphidius gifuensis TaxID=684658 RepID=A0A834XQJ0_APHGI|nr:hypothetical protein HCN44_008944 [Aphidius gifuensis]
MFSLTTKTTTTTMTMTTENMLVKKQRSFKKALSDDDIDGPTVKLDYINKLSDECLVKIFMNIPILKRIGLDKVCSNWKRIYELAWNDVKKINLQDLKQKRKDKTQALIIKILFDCGKYIKKLSVPFCISETTIIPIIDAACQNLVELELNFGFVPSDEFVLDGAFTQFNKLKKIKIRDSKYKRNKHDEIGKLFDFIIQVLPEGIEKIYISSVNGRIESRLNLCTAFKKFPSLCCLVLKNWKFNHNFNPVYNQLTKTKSLRYLDLKYTQICDGIDEVIINLINLEHLNIQHNDKVNDELLIIIANNCKKLKYLNIGYCQVSRANLKYVIKTLTHIEKLKISGISSADNSVIPIINMRKLNSLECANCPDITDTGIFQILENQPCLEYLDIAGTSTTQEILEHALIKVESRNVKLNLCIVTSEKNIFDFETNEYNEPNCDSLSKLELAFKENINNIFEENSYIDNYFDDYEPDINLPANSMITKKIRSPNNKLTEKKTNLINCLNVDCLAKIFTFIDPNYRLSLKFVCKKWKKATDISWYNTKKLNIKSIGYEVPTKKTGGMLKNFGPYLRELNTTYNKIDIELMPAIEKYCRNLVKLDLSILLQWYHHECLKNAFSAMKKLKYIKIDGCYCRKSELNSPKAYMTIMQNLPDDIEEIHFISHVPIRVSSNEAPMFEKFNKLRKLTIIQWQIDYAIVKIISQKSTIIDLDLNQCFLTNEGLQWIGNMNNLENLNIQHITNPYGSTSNEDPLMNILYGCKNLKLLNIAGLISSTNAYDKINRLKKLEILRMNNVVGDVHDGIFNNIYKLKILECASVNGINDEIIMKLLENCQELQELNISTTAITYKTIDYAFRIVEKRTNNIKLTITAQRKQEIGIEIEEAAVVVNVQEVNVQQEIGIEIEEAAVVVNVQEVNVQQEIGIEIEEAAVVVNVQEVNVQQEIGIEIEDSINDSVFQNIDTSIYETDEQNNPPIEITINDNNNDNNLNESDEDINLLDESDLVFQNIDTSIYNTVEQNNPPIEITINDNNNNNNNNNLDENEILFDEDDSVFQNIDTSIFDTDEQNNPPIDITNNNNNNNDDNNRLDENEILLDEDNELFMNVNMNIINERYLTNAAGNRIDEDGNLLDDDGNLIDSYADYITDDF